MSAMKTQPRTMNFSLKEEVLKDLIVAHLNAISVINDNEKAEIKVSALKDGGYPISLKLRKDNKIEFKRKREVTTSKSNG